MSNLRSKTIRLAHENPELREHLLPLLKKTALSRSSVGAFLEVFSSILIQYDKLLSKNEAKRGRENVYRLSHYMDALDKIRKTVAPILSEEGEEAMGQLRAAVDKAFTNGNPGDKLRKVIDTYLKTGTPPKIPIERP